MKSVLKASCLLGICLNLLVQCSAQTAKPCVVPDGQLATICFPIEPLTLLRCEHKLLPHFSIARKNDEPYYFGYQILLDNHPLAPEAYVGKGTYPFTSLDPTLEAAAYLDVPFSRSGTYELVVTAYVASSPNPVAQQSSGKQDILDAPRVRALIIGISQYKHGNDTDDTAVSNLNYADNDARAFAVLTRALFQASDVTILTSDDPNHLPTKDSISNELDNARGDESLCSNSDWFIFYFSGHGVVEDNGRQINRYLSAWDLDVTKVPETAISVVDVFDKLKHIQAQNNLVVFDSCFSGVNAEQRASKAPSSRAVRSSEVLSPRAIRRPKVEFVSKKRLVDPYDVSEPDPDIDAPEAYKTYEEKSQHAFVFLPAAKNDHVAEEGVVIYGNGNYSIADPSDGTIDREDKTLGHGYYTYILLSKLENQIPAKLAYPNVLRATDVWKQGDDSCNVSFMYAHILTQGAFINLRNGSPPHPDIQVPDDMKQSKEPVPAIKCQLLEKR